MKILWMTWKDGSHPTAGGAEIVNEALASRLVRAGHEVVFLTSAYPGSEPSNVRDGYRIIRRGGRFSVYFHTWREYRKNWQGWADWVIDEVNTIPFFASFYVQEKHLLLIHQLCRQIWFYEISWPCSWIGYFLEPLYLRLLSSERVLTVSESTRQDCIKMGFRPERIQVLTQGSSLKPLMTLTESLPKNPCPTILYLGGVRAMKRPDHIFKAFVEAKKQIPELQWILAGSLQGEFAERLRETTQHSPFSSSIHWLGPVSAEKKRELLQSSHLLCVTSVKEGWGLVVTEAGGQGTPAVAYDVDGLRDSVDHQKTGVLSEDGDPLALARVMVELLRDSSRYAEMRQKALEKSKRHDFDRMSQELGADLKSIDN